MTKVAVAVSGGVDSGVSASFLLEQGFDVVGLFMRHRYQRALSWEETREALIGCGKKTRLRVWTLDGESIDTLREAPCDPSDFPFPLPVDCRSAMELAAELGFELNLLDVDVPFSKIVDDFVEKYYSAQTPNPCALCNRTIKFGMLIDVAKRWNAELFATGHYVKKARARDWLENMASENPELFASLPSWLKDFPADSFIARSPSPKDQSYFLYGVSKESLERTIFPVGELEKSKVREIADEKNLSVAQRKDSQEICFAPDGDKLEFIRGIRNSDPRRWSRLPEKTDGPFLSLDGKEIGRHGGYEKFTIGQRKGLGMGFCERIFVQRVDPSTCSVVLGPYDALATTEIRAVDANWFANVPDDEEFRCEIKIRYRNESTKATVRAFDDGRIIAIPDKPCYGVAPGQALVCYWNDRLLGGGVIVK